MGKANNDLTVTIAGSAGAGKSTLAELIKRALPQLQIKVIDDEDKAEFSDERLSAALTGKRVVIRTVQIQKPAAASCVNSKVRVRKIKQPAKEQTRSPD